MGKATFSFYFPSLPLSEPSSLPSFQSSTGNFYGEIPNAPKPNVPSLILRAWFR